MSVFGATQQCRLLTGHHILRRLLASFVVVIACLAPLAGAASARVPFSSISVDARTGKVLFAVDPDGLRHPASLTKMMTLYLLFQDLKAGKIKLNSPIVISARAAYKAPSKLNVPPGTAISVETAIRAVVVISANDVATAIGETLGGSEQAFATRMTKTARAMGMSRTTFWNASGLPNPGQWTTARDMATLGLRLQRDFPEYYPYFRTMTFSYGGRTVKTHNRLLGKYDGADGIKTGYIAASGYNLTSSAQRDGKRLVGVVLGGATGGARNIYMMHMLDQSFASCTAGKTIAALAGSPKGAIVPKAAAAVVADAAPDKPDGNAPAAAAAADQTAEAAPADNQSSGDSADDGSDGTQTADTTPAKGSTIKTIAAPKKKHPVAQAAAPAKQPAEQPQVIEAQMDPPALPEKLPFEVKPEAQQSTVDAQAVAAIPEGSWHIQIGSYATKGDAVTRFEKLRANGPDGLRTKQGFIVTIQTGNDTIYKARFSGFTEKDARQACLEISRKNLQCQVVAPSS